MAAPRGLDALPKETPVNGKKNLFLTRCLPQVYLEAPSPVILKARVLQNGLSGRLPKLYSSHFPRETQHFFPQSPKLRQHPIFTRLPSVFATTQLDYVFLTFLSTFSRFFSREDGKQNNAISVSAKNRHEILTIARIQAFPSIFFGVPLLVYEEMAKHH